MITSSGNAATPFAIVNAEATPSASAAPNAARERDRSVHIARASATNAASGSTYAAMNANWKPSVRFSNCSHEKQSVATSAGTTCDATADGSRSRRRPIAASSSAIAANSAKFIASRNRSLHANAAQSIQ